MEINGTEIDFSKQRGYFFNMDCMDALKQMPDKSVSLALVDPPYGAGFTEGGGCQGWFKKYHQGDESSQICQVERERERARRRSRGTGSEDGSTDTNTLYFRDAKTGQKLPTEITRSKRKPQKNHFVGHSPGKRVFSRTFSCLTKSDYMGR